MSTLAARQSENGLVMPFTRVYTDAALLEELVRVAALVPVGPLTQAQFAAESSIDPLTFVRRFGSWREALVKIDLEVRYSGRLVTAKMRAQRSRRLSDEEVLAELRRLADADGCITQSAVRQSALISTYTPTVRFGSWAAAVAAAGLHQSAMANRWSDAELGSNLHQLVQLYRRPPTLPEMRRPPSRADRATYVRRFGSWEATLRWYASQAPHLASGGEERDIVDGQLGT